MHSCVHCNQEIRAKRLGAHHAQLESAHPGGTHTHTHTHTQTGLKDESIPRLNNDENRPSVVPKVRYLLCFECYLSLSLFIYLFIISFVVSCFFIIIIIFIDLIHILPLLLLLSYHIIIIVVLRNSHSVNNDNEYTRHNDNDNNNNNNCNYPCNIWMYHINNQNGL